VIFSTKRILSTQLGAFLFIFVAYLLIHYFNNLLTGFLLLLPGSHLVHIPSGFKLLFVLVGGLAGALGVVLASLVASLFYSFPDQYILGIQLAALNGLGPLLACRLMFESFKLDENLTTISTRQLVFLGLFFASLNSGLNQVVLYWNGISQNFLDGLLVMFIGDMTGEYIVFLLLKFLSTQIVKMR